MANPSYGSGMGMNTMRKMNRWICKPSQRWLWRIVWKRGEPPRFTGPPPLYGSTLGMSGRGEVFLQYDNYAGNRPKCWSINIRNPCLEINYQLDDQEILQAKLCQDLSKNLTQFPAQPCLGTKPARDTKYGLAAPGRGIIHEVGNFRWEMMPKNSVVIQTHRYTDWRSICWWDAGTFRFFKPIRIDVDDSWLWAWRTSDFIIEHWNKKILSHEQKRNLKLLFTGSHRQTDLLLTNFVLQTHRKIPPPPAVSVLLEGETAEEISGFKKLMAEHFFTEEEKKKDDHPRGYRDAKKTSKSLPRFRSGHGGLHRFYDASTAFYQNSMRGGLIACLTTKADERFGKPFLGKIKPKNKSWEIIWWRRLARSAKQNLKVVVKWFNS